jgi:tRNA(fMet)-specific endonuclease VapC
MLDTNTCVYFMKRRHASVVARFQQAQPEGLAISSLVAAELAYGVENSARPDTNRIALDGFFSAVEVMPWNEDAIWFYAKHKTRLRTVGKLIGELDLLLAAHALALDATFVTNNVREFERIEGLRVENWVA